MSSCMTPPPRCIAQTRVHDPRVERRSDRVVAGTPSTPRPNRRSDAPTSPRSSPLDGGVEDSQGRESGVGTTGRTELITQVIDHTTSPQTVDPARIVRDLRELVAALDRRIPQVHRVGETSIVQTAAAIRIDAVRRIAELEKVASDARVAVTAGLDPSLPLRSE
jgi:hypothetical protein